MVTFLPICDSEYNHPLAAFPCVQLLRVLSAQRRVTAGNWLACHPLHLPLVCAPFIPNAKVLVYRILHVTFVAEAFPLEAGQEEETGSN